MLLSKAVTARQTQPTPASRLSPKGRAEEEGGRGRAGKARRASGNQGRDSTHLNRGGESACCRAHIGRVKTGEQKTMLGPKTPRGPKLAEGGRGTRVPGISPSPSPVSRVPATRRCGRCNGPAGIIAWWEGGVRGGGHRRYARDLMVRAPRKWRGGGRRGPPGRVGPPPPALK